MHTHVYTAASKKTSPAKLNMFLGKGEALPFFQPQLTGNTPGDAYEQEADQVADRVMGMQAEEVAQPQALALTPLAPVQRQCAECEKEELQRQEEDGEEKEVQRMPMASSADDTIQRQCAACEQEEAQRKESGDGNTSGKAAPSIVGDVLSSGSGQVMDGGTRQFMESRFGHDFGQVRIHTDSRAAESASAIQARAYTSGRDIVFGAGQYQPESESGKRLLAHELAHVVQQGNERDHIQKDDNDQRSDSVTDGFSALSISSTNWQDLKQSGLTLATGLSGIRQIVVLTGSLRVFGMDGNLLGTFSLRGNFRPNSGVYVMSGRDGAGRLGTRNGRFDIRRGGFRRDRLSEDLQHRIESRGTSGIQLEDWVRITPERMREVFQVPFLMMVSRNISGRRLETERNGVDTSESPEPPQQLREGLHEGSDPNGTSLPDSTIQSGQFPALPATIQGPQVQPVGGTGDYSVLLTYPDAITGVGLRGSIGYRWELWNISNAPGVQNLAAQYGLLSLTSSPELRAIEERVGEGEVVEGGGSRQIINHSDGVSRRFERATSDLAERPDQIEADQSEALAEGRYLDALANEINSSLVGLEAVARYGSELLGAVSDNFHDGSERQIPWGMQGVYIIRCTAMVNHDAHEGASTYAPSIATRVVVVAPLEQVAQESIDAPSDEAAQLQIQLAGLQGLPEGHPDRAMIPALEERLRTLEILSSGDAIAVIRRNLQLRLNEFLTLIDSPTSLLRYGLTDRSARGIQSEINAQVRQLILAQERAGVPYSPQIESLEDKIDELISTMGSSDALAEGRPDRHVDRLRQEINSLITVLGLELSQGVEPISGSVSNVQRVQATLVSRITGQSYPLLLQIREPYLEEGTWRCQLSDVTDQQGRIYTGEAPTSSGGVEIVKLRAVTEVLERFAGGAGYGEGSLAVRLPNAGWFASLSQEQRNRTLESRPRDWAAARQRLEELAAAIALLGLVVSSPALGVVGAGLGAALAAQRFGQRVADGTFSWTDSQNISDLIDILSAAAVGLGAGVRAIGPMTVVAEGEGFALQLTRSAQRLVDMADHAETGLDVIGVIHCNAEATASLFRLSGQTGAEARRERAGIIAGVIQSNGMFAHQIGSAQDLSIHHSETEAHQRDSAQSSHRESSTADSADASATRDRVSDSGGGTEFITPEHLRALRGYDRARQQESAGSSDATSSTTGSERTMTGTSRLSLEAHQQGTDSQINETGNQDLRSPERLFELLGRGVDTQLPLTPLHGDQLQHPSQSIYRQGIETPEEAYQIYNEALAIAGGREVAIHYREQPHEYMVFMGDERGVHVPTGWRSLVHYHPNPTQALTYRLPAPADFHDMIVDFFRNPRTLREFVEFDIPGVGRGRTEYGVQVGQEQPFYIRIHQPDGSSEIFRFANDGDYTRFWSERTVYVNPDSPQYQHLIDDLDRYHNSRGEQGSDSNLGERTMVGTSSHSLDQLDAAGNLTVSDLTDSNYHAREYFEGDPTNPDGSLQARYYAEASLDENNILNMDFMIRRDDTPGAEESGSGYTRSSQLRGREQFEEAINHFRQQGQSVQGVRGSWGGGDNLQAFNATYQTEIQNGATHQAAINAAALATHTGRWAAEAGYRQVRIESQNFNIESGHFSEVTVVFIEASGTETHSSSSQTPQISSGSDEFRSSSSNNITAEIPTQANQSPILRGDGHSFDSDLPNFGPEGSSDYTTTRIPELEGGLGVMHRGSVPIPIGEAHVGTPPESLLSGGQLNMRDLMEIVPRGTENTFVHTQGLPAGFKYTFRTNGIKYEIKAHLADIHNQSPNIQSGANTRQGWTAQIKRNRILANGMNAQGEYLKTDGTWDTNNQQNDTHIPILDAIDNLP